MKLLTVFVILYITTLFAKGQDAPKPDQQNSPDYKITFSPGPKRIWEGWGISLCWWANVFGNNDALADICFTDRSVNLEGKTLPGLNLNIVRYNLGACSDNAVDGATMSLPAISPKAPAFRRMQGFWLDGKSSDPASSSWDWMRDQNQVAMLQKAKKRGVTYFELFSNSPMWWMCKNLNPSGALEGGSNLSSDHYKDFATYLATTARYAHDHWGIDFTSVEAFNEPSGGSWKGDGRQEGCHIGASEQALILPLLRAELDRVGLPTTPIAAPDENYYDRTLQTLGSYTSQIKQLLGQINAHGYEDKITSPRGRVYEAAEGKRLWATEYGNDDAKGLHMAIALSRDLNLLRPTAWCYWQLCDKPGWALIPADMDRATLMPANPKYFVLAQYTRHIRPGMEILPSSDPETVVAYDAKADKLVVVVCNEGVARGFNFDLSEFSSTAGSVVRWITEPKEKSRYEMTDITNGALSGKDLHLSLPAGCVETVEISGLAR